MKSIVTLFLAIAAFTISPVYGQGCDIVEPAPFLVNTNGITGGSGDCSSIGLAFGCEISLSGAGEGSCSGTANDTPFTATCQKDADGVVDCELVSDDTVATGLVDGFLVENVSGGQNALITSRFDVPRFVAACTNSQGKPSGNVYHMCLDGSNEPATVQVQTPLTECIVKSGDTKNVNGVSVSCDQTDPDQAHYVIVSKEFKLDETTSMFVEDPFHGFVDDDGQFSTDGICLCLGSNITDDQIAELTEPCDPTGEVVSGSGIDSLEECSPWTDEPARIIIEFGSGFKLGGGGTYYGP